MSKKVTFNIEEDEFKVPDTIDEMDELAPKLWEQYFDKSTKLKPTERRVIMDRYNMVAKARNKALNFTAYIILTPSTRIESKEPLAPATKPLPGQSVQSFNTQQRINGEAVVPVTAADVPPRRNTPMPKPISVPTTGTAAPGEPKPGSTIAQILELHKQGKTKKEIIEAGFNKSTVNRQVGEYIKRTQNK